MSASRSPFRIAPGYPPIGLELVVFRPVDLGVEEDFDFDTQFPSFDGENMELMFLAIDLFTCWGIWEGDDIPPNICKYF